jgi:hypothetical protein
VEEQRKVGIDLLWLKYWPVWFGMRRIKPAKLCQTVIIASYVKVYTFMENDLLLDITSE